MTMPDAIAFLRAPAMPEAAAPAAGAAAATGPGTNGFAATLAGVMGDADGAGAAAPGADSTADAGKAPAVMLEDLGKVAALLPGVGAVAAGMAEGVTKALSSGSGETEADGGTALPPAAAMQAALAQMGPKLTGAGQSPDAAGLPAGEAAEAASDDTELAEAEDPMAVAALPAAAMATAATVLPPEEGEAALGQAVAAALAGGAMQPMMQSQARPTAPIPPVPTGEGLRADGTEAEGGDFDDASAGGGTSVATEASQRREAAGLTPTLAQAVERAAARSGGTAAQAQLAEVPTGAPNGAPNGAGTAPAPAPQAMAQAAIPGGLAGFAAAGPILTERPGWEAALAGRISAELSGDGQQIDLELAPDHLGRLKIRLEMTDGLAQVRFVTETPEAARLIQANEHRLSDALSRAGLALGGQETASRDPQGERPARGEGPVGRLSERAVEATAAPATRPTQRGLVNLIA